MAGLFDQPLLNNYGPNALSAGRHYQFQNPLTSLGASLASQSQPFQDPFGGAFGSQASQGLDFSGGQARQGQSELSRQLSEQALAAEVAPALATARGIAQDDLSRQEGGFEYFLNSLSKPLEAAKNFGLVSMDLLSGNFGEALKSVARGLGSALPFSETLASALLPQSAEDGLAALLHRGGDFATGLGGNRFFDSHVRPRDMAAQLGSLLGEKASNQDASGGIFSEFGDSGLQDAATVGVTAAEVLLDPANWFFGAGAANKGLKIGKNLLGAVDDVARRGVGRAIPELAGVLASHGDDVLKDPTLLRSALAASGELGDDALDALVSQVQKAGDARRLELFSAAVPDQAKAFREVLPEGSPLLAQVDEAEAIAAKTGAKSLLPGATFREQHELGQRTLFAGPYGAMLKKLPGAQKTERKILEGLSHFNQSMGGGSALFKDADQAMRELRAGKLSAEEAATRLDEIGIGTNVLRTPKQKETFMRRMVKIGLGAGLGAALGDTAGGVVGGVLGATFPVLGRSAGKALRGGFLQDAGFAASQEAALLAPAIRRNVSYALDSAMEPVFAQLDEVAEKARQSGAFDHGRFHEAVIDEVEFGRLRDSAAEGDEIASGHLEAMLGDLKGRQQALQGEGGGEELARVNRQIARLEGAGVEDPLEALIKEQAANVQEAEAMLLRLSKANRAQINELDDPLDYFGRVFSDEFNAYLHGQPALKRKLTAWQSSFARTARAQGIDAAERGLNKRLRELLGIDQHAKLEDLNDLEQELLRTEKFTRDPKRSLVQQKRGLQERIFQARITDELVRATQDPKAAEKLAQSVRESLSKMGDEFERAFARVDAEPMKGLPDSTAAAGREFSEALEKHALSEDSARVLVDDFEKLAPESQKALLDRLPKEVATPQVAEGFAETAADFEDLAAYLRKEFEGTTPKDESLLPPAPEPTGVAVDDVAGAQGAYNNVVAKLERTIEHSRQAQSNEFDPDLDFEGGFEEVVQLLSGEDGGMIASMVAGATPEQAIARLKGWSDPNGIVDGQRLGALLEEAMKLAEGRLDFKGLKNERRLGKQARILDDVSKTLGVSDWEDAQAIAQQYSDILPFADDLRKAPEKAARGAGKIEGASASKEMEALIQERERVADALERIRDKRVQKAAGEGDDGVQALADFQREIDDLDSKIAALVNEKLQYGKPGDWREIFTKLEPQEKAAWVRHWLKEQGHNAPAGFRTGLELFMDAGHKTGLPRDLESIVQLGLQHVPEGVFTDWRKVNEVIRNPNGLVRSVDGINSLFRRAFLSTPTSLANDLMGNALTLTLLGGYSPNSFGRGLRSYLAHTPHDAAIGRLLSKPAKKAAKSAEDAVIQTAFGPMRESQIIQELERRGVYRLENQVTERKLVTEPGNALTRAAKKTLIPQLTDQTLALREINDNAMRTAVVLEELKKGASIENAISRARELFFDYSDTTRFENVVARRSFLFYAFARKAVPLVLRSSLERPIRFKMMQMLMGAGANSDNPDFPDWARRVNGLYMGQDSAGNPQVLSVPGSLMGPATDILEGNVLENLLRAASPIARTGGELATDRDFFTGQPLGWRQENATRAQSGLGADRAPAWMRFLPKGVQAELGFTERVNRKGEITSYEMDPRARWILENALPFGQLSRTAEVLSGADERKTPLTQRLPLLGVAWRSVPQGARDEADISHLRSLRDKVQLSLMNIAGKPLTITNGVVGPNRRSKAGLELAKALETADKAARAHADRLDLHGLERSEMIEQVKAGVMRTVNPKYGALAEVLQRIDDAYTYLREPEVFGRRLQKRIESGDEMPLAQGLRALGVD